MTQIRINASLNQLGADLSQLPVFIVQPGLLIDELNMHINVFCGFPLLKSADVDYLLKSISHIVQAGLIDLGRISKSRRQQRLYTTQYRPCIVPE